MDDIAAAVPAVVRDRCLGIRQPPTAIMTFPTRTFEAALRTKGTGWFHKKRRYDKSFFLRIYKLVHVAWGREPAPNCKHQVIKHVALAMLYLAQGGTMDQAATKLGISSLVQSSTSTRPWMCSASWPNVWQ
ncbi:hypothetical protein PC129_g3543 [Phytophthora cactorum]|uniref:Uncharacterized protein n=1 Tax=Phytophthora cactorum TaxID=29920 RepID=A0A329RFT6_9STRA|nr:hypothetical protein Pcac1_g11598 [Phytophthora cactorum]KAG2802650.1 hypothetical protein PC111_g19018 [Phytophthora cactorum]KAG2805148.1 hypothetical protein PC112_g18391 [Phytophthora cactorum]KAG2845200.1 hypothetical protein PC113_g18241 [Phytophthora cactorum]KAG2877554.1 hypothetical protein PC114_g23565 [Phytophthora cactorum]